MHLKTVQSLAMALTFRKECESLPTGVECTNNQTHSQQGQAQEMVNRCWDNFFRLGMNQGYYYSNSSDMVDYPTYPPVVCA